jgi:regulator of sirC expression with transglutaminase-like and TPR domain
MELDAALLLLSKRPKAPVDVAEVALRLACDEYPDLDVEAGLGELTGMAHEAGRYLKGDLETRVRGLCRYLFHDMGFRGNAKNYYDPRNSYLNQVLERRTGIPITLAAVFQAVGQRAGLDVEGVGLPGHFIAKVKGTGQEVFVDCFHGGRLLTLTDCEHVVRQATGLPFLASPLALEGMPPGLIITRMLNNLRKIYLEAEDHRRAARVLRRLLQLQPRDPSVHRDLGAALVRLEKYGKAIDHLSFYLDQAAEAEDIEAVRKTLNSAKAQVAKWN